MKNILLHFRGDFLRRLLLIAFPIALQTMLFSSRSLVDIMMLGQLGEQDVAAIGIAGRAVFVVTIMIFGVTTGGALLTAQYWGAGNREGVRQSTALTVLMTLLAALGAGAVFLLVPEAVIGMATNSDAVIALGAEYLRITAFSLFALAWGSSIAVGLRAMHQPGITTFFSAIGIGLNVCFNWVLIFGHLGFPAMGIAGAAWATLLSGVIEAVLLYGYLRHRQHLLAINPRLLIDAIEWGKVRRFLSLSMPTTFNHLAWSFGIFAYHAIIGQSGVQGLAALSVMTPIESFALALLIGVSNASAVLIGNQLGANNHEAAYYQAWAVSWFNFCCAVVVALVMVLLKDTVLDLFTALSGESRKLADHFFLIFAVAVVVKSIPMTMIVGVLRAGGDIRYCLYQDMVAQWLIGIPLTAFCAFILQLPLEWIYAMLMLEELVKSVGSCIRLKSRVWMNNLVADG
ncbi:MATE family efflux transporter [Photobacterium atrarenae]|uniref:Multidrug resistance protein NorM n=1 Tax=Photobacterium atrarenae TaxID=865757 RepID=A0ABY5GI22_9GAMM|nr:MATE family efflux transporter [Photobacterium atrarenae]UTV28927.1 MATE family efflux transporter [Photobacterium atrarenae]